MRLNRFNSGLGAGVAALALLLLPPLAASPAAALGSAATSGAGAPAVTPVDPTAAEGAPSSLSVNGIPAPMDVDTTPRFGWHVGTARQSGYEIVVASTEARAAAGDGDVWTSGPVASAEQTGIAYAGDALTPGQRYFWTVRTTDAVGTVSPWAPVSSFGIGPGQQWQHSSAIWAPSVVDSWRDYTLETRVRIDAVATGITLRASSSGTSLMWQFRGDNNRLVPHTQVNGTYAALPAVSLPSGTLAVGKTVDITIEAVGDRVRTWIDDVLVDTSTITVAPQSSRGGIGVRHGRTEAATYESLEVTAADGSTLLSTSFEDGDRTFGCGTVANGALTVGLSAVCLQSGLTSEWALLRGSVELADKPIAWATLSASATNPRTAKQYVHKLAVNGEFVGLGPTIPIGSEARYDGFDVTDLLRAGEENVVSATAYATDGQQFQAELLVAYADGTRQVLGTGPEWRARTATDVWPAAGSIGTSFYAAPKENLDLRALPAGWSEPGFDASGWRAAAARPALPTLRGTPTDKVEQQLHEPVRIVEKAPGHYFVDFGRTWIGGVHYDIAQASAGAKVDLRFGEVPSGENTVRYQLNTGNTYQDVVTLRAGAQTVETWGARVFRYVEIIGAPEPVTAENLKALALVYPFDADASRFASSSPNLDAVYGLSKNTIESTNMNFYTDSWTRERINYEADAYLQLMSTLYLMDDLSLGRYSMDYFRSNRTWPTEWPIYVVLAVHDAWRQTGDLEQPADYYDNLVEKLPTEWIDPATGLVRKTSRSNGCNSQTDCDIVDWPTSERDGYQFRQYNTVLNALSYRAYRDMAAMADALGKADDAASWTAIADTMRASMNERLYDPETGSYDDGLDANLTPTGHSALHASAFSLAFGVPEAGEQQKVADQVASRGMACSVYCAGFLVPGLFDGGNGQAGLDLLTATGTKSWMNMIELGAGATAEAWDPSLKPNLTYSHPWAASPAFSVPAGLFGIEPIDPGYATFAVRPQPGDLEWATIATPTVRGSVGVAFDREGAQDGLRMAVSVPGNTAGTISVPTEATGPVRLYVDGTARTLRPEGGFVTVAGVPGGCHVLSFDEALPAGSEADERLLSVCEAAPSEGLALLASVEGPSGEGWQGAGSTLTLGTVGDPGAIETVVEYALVDPETEAGTEEWQAYTGSIALPAGVYEARYRWREAGAAPGEGEDDGVLAVGSQRLAVDTRAPRTSAHVRADRRLVINSSDAATGGVGVSGVSRVEYRVGSGAWRLWTAPIVLTAPAQSIEHRAVDRAGNVGATSSLRVPAVSSVRVSARSGATTVSVTARVSTPGTQPRGRVEVFRDGRRIGSAWLREGRVSTSFRAAPGSAGRIVVRYLGTADARPASAAVVYRVARR